MNTRLSIGLCFSSVIHIILTATILSCTSSFTPSLVPTTSDLSNEIATISPTADIIPSIQLSPTIFSQPAPEEPVVLSPTPAEPIKSEHDDSNALTPSPTTFAEEVNNQDFIINLKSRNFTPEPGIEPAVDKQLQDASTGKRIHVLVQFWQIPSDDDRGVLENKGIELLDYVPFNTWFASIPSGLDLQTIPLTTIRWIGPIQPEDRMAPALQTGEIAPYAINEDGTVNLDLRFFADVTQVESMQLLAKYNAVVETEAAELHRFTVRVNLQTISSLASEDKIQWITLAAPPKAIQ